MDAYIIHKIALYVKDSKIVKLLFYISIYRDLINTSDSHYDELVLLYSKKNWDYPWTTLTENTNDFKIIKSFYRLNIPFTSAVYMDHINLAAENGHLELLKWLYVYENQYGGKSTTFTMDCAAFNGHLEIVKWLHENRKEGCSFYAMDRAAYKGHLEVIKWLHENRKEGCSKNAMNYAACKGHLEVIKWLHENRTEGCTTGAINMAASNGHIEVVKWLYQNRYECSRTIWDKRIARDNAVRYGHFALARWFSTID